MGPENVLGGVIGAMISKVQLQTLFAVGVIAIMWLLYRDFIWNKIK